MGVQIIDADAKCKCGGNVIFSPAASSPSGILGSAYIQPAIYIWKWPGNPCPAAKEVSKRAKHTAIRREKYWTSEVTEHIHAVSTAENILGAHVTKIQFRPKVLACIHGNACIHSAQGSMPRRWESQRDDR